MQEEYEPDLVSLSDDDGKNYNFEILDTIVENDVQYVAMTPYVDDEADDDDNTVQLDDDGSLVIMKIEIEDGENYFAEIENDEEYEKIANEFVERLQDYYEIDEQ